MNTDDLADKLAERLRPVIEDALRGVLLEAAPTSPILPARIRRRPGWLSRIERNPEIEAAAIELYTSHRTITQARTALIERFGENRAPSRSSLGRFFQSLGRSV